MRLISFINDSAEIRKILDHIGVESSPPKISQARGPPLWDADDATPEEYAGYSYLGHSSSSGVSDDVVLDWAYFT